MVGPWYPRKILGREILVVQGQVWKLKFRILHEIYLAIEQGGRDKLLKELSTKYKSVKTGC